MILFELLEGRVPYDGDSAGDVLRAHISAPLPRLPALDPSIERVVHGLLQKDAADRYASAWDVVADLRCAREPGRVPRPRRGGVPAPYFVGRAAEMEALLRALDDAASCVELHAPSGTGKSRLLEEFGLRVWRRGGLVLEASAAPTDASGGFLLEPVARQALERGALRGVDLAESDRQTLAALLPPLQGWLGAVGERADEPSTDQTVETLVGFLERLSRPERQVVVLLDDCQQADALTLRVLRAWMSLPRRGGTLIVAAWRDDEAPPHALHLRGLVRDELEQLATQMVGPQPDALVDFVETASGGNPFLAIEAVRGLVAEGTLLPREGAFELRTEALSSAATSDRGAAFLSRRLQRLAGGARATLSIGAILGRTFAIPQIVALSGEPAEDVRAAAERARALALVRSDGRLSYTFQHDRIRESLIDDLEPSEQADLHLRIARTMQADAEASPRDVCYHLEHAGRVAECVDPALAAAAEMRLRRDYETSARYLRLAREGLAADDPRRQAVLESLADVLLKLGNWDEADACVQAALLECTDGLARARLLLRLARRRRHEFDPRGLAFLGEALAETGHPLPRPGLPTALALVTEVVRQLVHTWFPGHVARGAAADRERDLLAADLCYELVILTQTSDDILTALWGLLKQLNVAEPHPPSPQLGLALSEHVAFLAVAPRALESRAEHFVRRAQAIASSLDHPLLQGGVSGRTGFLRVNQGRVAEARTLLTEAAEHARQHFDKYEKYASNLWLGYVECATGDVAAGTQRLQALWGECWRGGDRLSSSTALFTLGAFSGGHLERADVELELTHPSPAPFVRPQAQRARGFWRLGQGDFIGAAADFEQAQAVPCALRLLTDLGQAWRATAHRLAAASLPLEAREQRREHLRLARRAARAAAAAGTRLVQPHGLREAALLAVEKGHPYRARALFEQSQALAREQGNRFDEAWTLFERGRVGRWLAWPDADDDLRMGRGRLAAMGLEPGPLERAGVPTMVAPLRPSPVGLAERLSDAIGAGRVLVASLDADEVLAAVHDAALRLLRAQDGVVLAPRDGRWVRAAGSAGLAFSASTVERAARDRDAVAIEEAAAASAHESLVLGEVRSVLAVPLIAREQVAAVVYVVHSQVAGLFAEDEIRLARFLAAIGGAALENAMGFREILALSRSLEDERVRLQATLEEKRVMLAEIHHRVRNNLQLFASMLSLERRHAGAAAPLVDDLLSRVHAMSSLQDLMYDADDYARVPMPTYVEAVIRHLHDIVADSVKVEIDVQPDLSLPLARAIPCGLLVNELVSNSLRHAQARTLRVRVEARGLAVEDDGRGMPEGFDPAATESTGLTIVRALVGQLGGTIRFEGPGTRALVAW